MTSRILAASGVVLVPVIVAAAFLWAAALPPSSAPSEDTFSFEQSLEGWTAEATDLSSGNCTGAAEGNCTVAWAIARSTELAHEGGASVKMFLENLNDQGKIWIERAFNVTPSRTYRVHVAFAFASADYGSVNHWTILAGAVPHPPRSAADLTSVIRGDTANGHAADSGYVWLDKAYDSTVTSDASGHLWVVVGVWGTWETPRTYFVDTVLVTIEPV